MNMMAEQSLALFKLGVCLLPLAMALYFAAQLAVRKGMSTAARWWKRGAKLALAVIFMSLLAGAILWLIG